MQDLSPQTKAKTTARISFRDFTDAFNAVGLVLMMSIHILLINCSMHNPDVFAERSVRAPSTEKFKADPTFKNMMRYLIDQILMRRRTVKQSTNDWDCAAYLDEEEEEDAPADQNEASPIHIPKVDNHLTLQHQRQEMLCVP